jgi:hypothetical protein
MKMMELLNRKTKWTRHSFAETKTGKATTTANKSATKWCLYGALLKCYPTQKRAMKVSQKLNLALQKLYPDDHSIIYFNDSPKTTFKDIRKLLKEANV